MSAYSDALAQLAILHTAQNSSSLPADMDHAIRALQTAVGAMLPADSSTIQANSSYVDLLKQAGYLEDMSQTANYDQGVVTTDADILTGIVNGMIAAQAAAAVPGNPATATPPTPAPVIVNVPPATLPPVTVTPPPPSSTATIVIAAGAGLLVGMLLVGLARKAGL